MNKAQFLKQLRYRLEGRLPEEELADVLSYYEAYFDDSEEDEEAVAERLGSPASVAEQVLKDAGDCTQRVSTPPPALAGRRRPALLWVIGAVAVIIVLSVILLTTIRPVDSPTPPAPSASAGAAGSIQESPDPAEVSPQSSEPIGSNQDVLVTLAPFDALELDVAVASVQLKTGSEWKLRLASRSQDTSEDSYQLNWRNTDGVLSVWSTPSPTDVLPSQSSMDYLVEVTVPEDAILDRAELALGVGSLDWDGCTVSGRLKAESGVGDLHVSAPLGMADLSAGVGDVTLKLAAPVEKADLIAGIGSVTLEIAGNQSDYSWLLSTDTGDIRLNGDVMSPFWSEGGSGERTLSLVSGTGDVSLAFQ